MVFICLLTTPSRAYEAYNLSATSDLSDGINKLPFNQRNTNKSGETSPALMCRLAAERAEKTYQVKKNLLVTIASVESGRWDEERGERVAWPWTVQANGRGKYYATKAEAVAAVKELQRQGITNVDVGCMQINLKYHGEAFNSLEEAFDPQNNVNYSAAFLKKMQEKNRNWQKTAMHYHSKNPDKGATYKDRLEKHYTMYVQNDGLAATLF